MSYRRRPSKTRTIRPHGCSGVADIPVKIKLMALIGSMPASCSLADTGYRFVLYGGLANNIGGPAF